MRRKQSGMTFTSFVIVLSVVGFFLFIFMKLFPMYQEFFSVKSALNGLSADPEVAVQSPEQIKDKFFKRLYVSYSENVKPQNVRFENRSGTQVMHVDYEVRKPLIYNLDVVGKFSAEATLGGKSAN
ncbi:MAG: DUF4845 domain-containing protein [Lysobacteraceae bacterium]